MKIAIIGAGMAGAACAQRLTRAGHAVTLFDKARGPGGRMSTRRVETPFGEARFDHGAQYVTARSAEFSAVLQAWVGSGAAQVWSGPFGAVDGGGVSPEMPSTARWLGTPGMNGLVRAALDGLDVRFSHRVTALSRDADGWRLQYETQDAAGGFDQVVVAVPAEQVGPLLEASAPDLAQEASHAISAPCWTVMAIFPGALESPYAGLRWRAGALGWAAREASKPARTALADGVEAWVLQASSEWSKTHLEAEPAFVQEHLAAVFCEAVGAPAPLWSAAHRWRFAQVETAADTPFACDRERGVGVCGDWRSGPRVEFAWASGDALGAAMLEGV